MWTSFDACNSSLSHVSRRDVPAIKHVLSLIKAKRSKHRRSFCGWTVKVFSFLSQQRSIHVRLLIKASHSKDRKFFAGGQPVRVFVHTSNKKDCPFFVVSTVTGHRENGIRGIVSRAETKNVANVVANVQEGMSLPWRCLAKLVESFSALWLVPRIKKKEYMHAACTVYRPGGGHGSKPFWIFKWPVMLTRTWSCDLLYFWRAGQYVK